MRTQEQDQLGKFIWMPPQVWKTTRKLCESFCTRLATLTYVETWWTKVNVKILYNTSSLLSPCCSYITPYKLMNTPNSKEQLPNLGNGTVQGACECRVNACVFMVLSLNSDNYSGYRLVCTFWDVSGVMFSENNTDWLMTIIAWEIIDYLKLLATNFLS